MQATINKSLCVIAAGVLAGCAHWGAPPEEALRELPVIPFGQAVPANGEYVLHFPAGAPIKSSAFVRGNAFVQNAEAPLTVALRRDLYTYKDWISFDRRQWLRRDKAIDFKVEFNIPSQQHPRDGEIGVTMNLK